LLLAGVIGGVVWAQKPQQPPAGPPAEQAPPEEDENLSVKQYAFNPLQASKELQVGRFYMKKGNFRAAAHRFEEATRWDGSNAEAFLLLGEAREKQKEHAAAREAYAKYLELAPEAKNAAAIRKKVESLRAARKR
jgi:tetratricopeptide (TPR) repeat protein